MQYVTTVDNLEQAAAAAALGYPLISRQNLTSVQQDNGRHRYATIWHFEDVPGRPFNEFRARWAEADWHLQQDNIVTRVRAALSNFKTLTTLRKFGGTMWACADTPATWLAFVRMHARSVQVPSAAAAGACSPCVWPVLHSAVALANGWRPVCYSRQPGDIRMALRTAEDVTSAPVDSINRVDDLTWVGQPNNMDPVAVCAAAIINRGKLLEGAYTGPELVAISNGNRVGIICKDAPLATQDRLANHLNI